MKAQGAQKTVKARMLWAYGITSMRGRRRTLEVPPARRRAAALAASRSPSVPSPWPSF